MSLSLRNMGDAGDITKAVAGIVKVVPIYEDALRPVAKEVGKSLKTVGGVINIVLAPLEAMVFGYGFIREGLFRRLEEKLKKINPNNIISPQLSIVGPLIDKYRYVYKDPDLSEMFINLLAKAMNKETVREAHPSFIHIISELSPDEARLIKTIKNEEILPKIDIKIQSKDEAGGFMYATRNFTDLDRKTKLNNPELIENYLSNLERLGIIKGSSSDSGGIRYVKEEFYRPLEKRATKKFKPWADSLDRIIKVDKGMMEITDFGRMFMIAVLNRK